MGVEHHGETGAELLVLAVWVVALFVVQWLWNVSSSRAMTPIDAWPLTFHLDLFIEMLHRMILLQLAPFEGGFFAFIILHALVGVVRHSDLGTMVTRKVFGIKRNLMDASDWALTADRLEERSLRCQAGFVASALASLVSFIAVGGDAVLNFGDPGGIHRGPHHPAASYQQRAADPVRRELGKHGGWRAQGAARHCHAQTYEL